VIDVSSWKAEDEKGVREFWGNGKAKIKP